MNSETGSAHLVEIPNSGLDPTRDDFAYSRGYRNTDNQRRHFERLRRWPEGFVVIGDASCTFNPIYGQGMTVAAMTAVALDQILTKQRKRSGADLFGPARQLQRQVAKTNTGAWTMATPRTSATPGPRARRSTCPRASCTATPTGSSR